MNHFLRKMPTANADPSRTRLNQTLVGEANPQAIAAQCAAIPARQKNVVRSMGFVLSASPEFFGDDWRAEYERDPKRINKWRDVAVDWLKKEFGDRLIFADFQLDETTPHIQGLIIPTDPKTGRLNARKVFGKVALNGYQTSAGKAFAPLGIERGKEGSKAEHTRIKDYYAALKEPLPKVTLPALPPPPGVFSRTEENLAEWGKEVQQATWKAVAPAYAQAARAANAGREAVKQRDKITAEQATWKKSADYHATRARELDMKLDEMREIDVAETLAALGFEQDAKEREKWKNGGAIITTKDGFAWFDHVAQKGGGGSLDLVQHVLDCPLGKAAGWMRKEFGTERAARSVAAPAIRQARETVAKAEPSPTAPEPSETRWERVKRYLVGRSLPAPLIDALKAAGDLYADARANAVFACRDAAGAVSGASLRGTGGSAFKQRLGKKDAGCFAIGNKETAKTVVVTESAIDAASYYALAKHYGYEDGLLVISTDGAGKPPAWLMERHKAAQWCLSHDADERGDALAEALGKALSQAGMKNSRYRPTDEVKDAKDWNDVLRVKFGGDGGGGYVPKASPTPGFVV